jgi:diguanylate cyclase (GGDEF)-like protein
MAKKEDTKKTKAELLKEIEGLRERVRELENPKDQLTGLYNWIHFLTIAEREFERSIRYKRPMSLMLLDVDDLKGINRDYNRACGDQVLVEVSKRCEDNIRELDHIGCYEGGKFILLLVETDRLNAKKAGERIRKVVVSRPILTDKGAVKATVSVGVAGRITVMTDISALLEKADEALFLAKDRGRNRVETSGN